MYFPRNKGIAMLLLALLCILAYAPTLSLPLIEDDYPSLSQATEFGSFAGVLASPVFRLRATSSWLMLLLWRQFHLAPLAYHAASLTLHIFCTWLVYFLCLSWRRLQPAAFWAAAFFAVQEGHQEAVMWFTAINELFQFVFGAAALLCWVRAPQGRFRWPLEIAGVALFAMALVSKESAVIFLPLFLLTQPPAEWRRTLVRFLPYLALGLIAVGSLIATRSYSFRFADGSFSLHAPFWFTWPRGITRLLWFWGWVALAILYRYRRELEICKAVGVALLWIAISFGPYIFLTYSTQIPSRQTYLASAGLAAIIGLALARLIEDGLTARKAAFALAGLMLVHNTAYLWTKKRAQFVERAAPTEQLIQLGRRSGGPIWVACFPRPAWIAQEALHLGAGIPPFDVIWTKAEASERTPAAIFCYNKP